jgi:hypothetical protein
MTFKDTIWFIEDIQQCQDIKEVLAKEGYKVIEVNYHKSHNKFKEIYNQSLFPSVFFGSVALANQVLKNTNLVPGAYCNLSNLACSKYYNYFKYYLLNLDFFMHIIY